jgi:hypothetical protein
MRKPVIVALAAMTTVIVLTVAVAVQAATLNPSQIGTSCEGPAVWHFVNNQTGGAAAGTLTATFSTDSGTLVFVVGATTVLSNTQHFFVSTGEGATLLSAETNLPGRLVLSDVDCGVSPPPPPPPPPPAP